MGTERTATTTCDPMPQRLKTLGRRLGCSRITPNRNCLERIPANWRHWDEWKL